MAIEIHYDDPIMSGLSAFIASALNASKDAKYQSAQNQYQADAARNAQIAQGLNRAIDLPAAFATHAITSRFDDNRRIDFLRRSNEMAQANKVFQDYGITPEQADLYGQAVMSSAPDDELAKHLQPFGLDVASARRMATDNPAQYRQLTTTLGLDQRKRQQEAEALRQKIAYHDAAETFDALSAGSKQLYQAYQQGTIILPDKVQEQIEAITKTVQATSQDPRVADNPERAAEVARQAEEQIYHLVTTTPRSAIRPKEEPARTWADVQSRKQLAPNSAYFSPNNVDAIYTDERGRPHAVKLEGESAKLPQTAEELQQNWNRSVLQDKKAGLTYILTDKGWTAKTFPGQTTDAEAAKVVAEAIKALTTEDANGQRIAPKPDDIKSFVSMVHGVKKMMNGEGDESADEPAASQPHQPPRIRLDDTNKAAMMEFMRTTATQFGRDPNKWPPDIQAKYRIMLYNLGYIDKP